MLLVVAFFPGGGLLRFAVALFLLVVGFVAAGRGLVDRLLLFVEEAGLATLALLFFLFFAVGLSGGLSPVAEVDFPPTL